MEWNGYYGPSLLQAQTDAINLISGVKTQSNPENTVGILIMAGKGVRVSATPTTDAGKILACTHGLSFLPFPMMKKLTRSMRAIMGWFVIDNSRSVGSASTLA